MKLRYSGILVIFLLAISGLSLVAGCGSGYSIELITKELRPQELVAFDVMPEQIELARQRGLSANVFVGDATNIELPSNKFDAVFVFDILQEDFFFSRPIRFFVLHKAA